MDQMKKYFLNDRFAAHSGIELIDVSPGYAKAKMDITDCHINSHGSVHGAAIFALADYAFGVAGNTHGTAAVAINVSINYLKAVASGTLTAEAREVSRGNKLASYDVDVRDENSNLVATFQGLAYRKKDRLPFAK